MRLAAAAAFRGESTNRMENNSVDNHVPEEMCTPPPVYNESPPQWSTTRSSTWDFEEFASTTAFPMTLTHFQPIVECAEAELRVPQWAMTATEVDCFLLGASCPSPVEFILSEQSDISDNLIDNLLDDLLDPSTGYTIDTPNAFERTPLFTVAGPTTLHGELTLILWLTAMSFSGSRNSKPMAHGDKLIYDSVARRAPDLCQSRIFKVYQKIANQIRAATMEEAYDITIATTGRVSLVANTNGTCSFEFTEPTATPNTACIFISVPDTMLNSIFASAEAPDYSTLKFGIVDYTFTHVSHNEVHVPMKHVVALLTDVFNHNWIAIGLGEMTMPNTYTMYVSDAVDDTKPIALVSGSFFIATINDVTTMVAYIKVLVCHPDVAKRGIALRLFTHFGELGRQMAHHYQCVAYKILTSSTVSASGLNFWSSTGLEPHALASELLAKAHDASKATDLTMHNLKTQAGKTFTMCRHAYCDQQLTAEWIPRAVVGEVTTVELVLAVDLHCVFTPIRYSLLIADKPCSLLDAAKQYNFGACYTNHHRISRPLQDVKAMILQARL